MAFIDDLARDPKSENEFWAIIDETFVQVKGTLTAYPVETREDALSGAMRGGNFKDASLSFFRYRGVDKDIAARPSRVLVLKKIMTAPAARHADL